MFSYGVGKLAKHTPLEVSGTSSPASQTPRALIRVILEIRILETGTPNVGALINGMVFWGFLTIISNYGRIYPKPLSNYSGPDITAKNASAACCLQFPALDAESRQHPGSHLEIPIDNSPKTLKTILHLKKLASCEFLMLIPLHKPLHR